MTLSVVIPALNEEGGIAEVIERIQSAGPELHAMGIDTEILVVDDGSVDRTAEIVNSLPGVRLVQHAERSGYGAALKTGFSAATGELLAFLDADGTYPPEHFPRLCKAAIEQNADVVVGSRRSGAKSEMPAVRRLGNLIWSTIVSLLASRTCADPASGMRVFRRSAIRKLYPLPDGLNFTPVMSTRALHEHLNLVEIPIPYSERLGRSKLSVVRDGTRFLKTILWTALEYSPAKLFGLVGVGFAGVAAAIGAGLVIARSQGVTTLDPVATFTLFAALVLAVCGVSIYSLGVTFNFLVSLFHGHPMSRGLFGDSKLEQFFEARFGWMGLAGIVAGIGLSATPLVVGGAGWDMARSWLWFLGGAGFTLVGFQLLTCWILARTLEKLAVRQTDLEKDLASKPLKTAKDAHDHVVVGVSA
ncbi:MAG: glycosyltransferase family 2 protein [Bryobacterales bacterium]|nr:glycosyltransferase family 2 protein [Acidobacteriota bacterium]MCB9384634.1 glycosyltransferase family 2 protein [Bryobacterales bacterium]